jgi:hypothetical protein
LELADDRAKQAGCEQSWSERSGPIFTDWWELPERRPGRRRHVAELPSDLVGDSLWRVGGSKASRLGGVRGSTQGVCAHVGDGCGLPGRFGGSRR